jgi:riboflavin synthase
MFTGIVEETGRVEKISHKPAATRLTISATIAAVGLKMGSSLAVNGCCLTVVGLKRAGKKYLLDFDLLRETWVRTNLQFAVSGTLVNLERPLGVGNHLGGHMLSGHVDEFGEITGWEKQGQDYYLEVQSSRALAKQLFPKSSIAIDGISLTVAKVTRDRFGTWIIPHTFSVTNLKQREVGDAINLETDLLGKYVQRFLSARSKA